MMGGTRFIPAEIDRSPGHGPNLAPERWESTDQFGEVTWSKEGYVQTCCAEHYRVNPDGSITALYGDERTAKLMRLLYRGEREVAP